MWLRSVVLVLGGYYVIMATCGLLASIPPEIRGDGNYRRAVIFGLGLPLIPLIGLEPLVSAFEEAS